MRASFSNCFSINQQSRTKHYFKESNEMSGKRKFSAIVLNSNPFATSGLSPIDSDWLSQSEGRICVSALVGLY